MRTPTTVASAAPELKPNKLMAAATASSKKLLTPINAEGPATQWAAAVGRGAAEGTPMVAEAAQTGTVGAVFG
jgi:hypothetical protein